MEYGGESGNSHPNGTANAESTVVFADSQDCFIDLAWDAFTGSALSIDIKANGSDGPLSVSPGTFVAVTCSLSPGGQAGLTADWWIHLDTVYGTFSFVHPIGWRPGLRRTILFPLFTVSSGQVFNAPLPVGDYTFNFAVDNNGDGVFDGTWMDSVLVQVQ